SSPQGRDLPPFTPARPDSIVPTARRSDPRRAFVLESGDASRQGTGPLLIGPGPGAIVAGGGRDAGRRDRQALYVRAARSPGLLAGGVAPPAPAGSVEGLGSGHRRGHGDRVATVGTPRARQRGARAEPLPALRRAGGRGARGPGGYSALHHGELAPVHGPA